MRHFTKFLMTAFVFTVMGASHASAQYDFEGFKKMSGSNVKSLFSGRTFWGKNQHDRFFFGKDGSFAQQYVKAGQSFKPGSTFYGNWTVDGDGAVCVSYSQSNVGKSPEGQCFDVYMGPDKHKALPKYTDPLYLVDKGDTSRTDVKYFWSRWIDGRLVFDPTFAANFEKQLAFIDQVVSKFDANSYKTTPPYKDLGALPADAQNYVKAISGKVMYTPYDYLYFAPNGDYLYYPRGEFEANKNDIAKLRSKAKRGRWIMFKNIHCWSLYGERKRTSCQYVGQGNTLDQPFEGYVTHMQDGFSRLLNGNPVGIMEPEQTGAAAAFSN